MVYVWDEIREKEFPNRVFTDLPSVTRQLEQGLPRLAADPLRLRSLTVWPWMISLNLNATWNQLSAMRSSDKWPWSLRRRRWVSICDFSDAAKS